MANEEGIAQLENLRCVATANCSFGASSMPKLRLHPTRLETHTKESNMCASLRVIEIRGCN